MTDDLGAMAHPRAAIDGRRPDALVRELSRIAAEEGVRRFVVGLPLDMKGGEGASAGRVRELAQRIANATGCEVELWDERLTTVEARRRLAEADVHGRNARGRVDSGAAAVILQA